MKLNEPRKRIAYIVSRFPKITETFILFEIVELARLGTEVAVFSILRENEGVMHAEAAPIVERAHYCDLFSWAVLRSQIFWLRRSPARYVRAWWRSLVGNAASPSFFLRALAVVPAAAHFARQMQEERIEHVHASWATHTALAAYVVHILAGIPYSFTAHAHEIYCDRTMLGEKIRHSEFFVTISEYNRRMLTELMAPSVPAGCTWSTAASILRSSSLEMLHGRISRSQFFALPAWKNIKGSDTSSKPAPNCVSAVWIFVVCWSAKAKTVRCSNGKCANWELNSAYNSSAGSRVIEFSNSWPRPMSSPCKAS